MEQLSDYYLALSTHMECGKNLMDAILMIRLSSLVGLRAIIHLSPPSTGQFFIICAITLPLLEPLLASFSSLPLNNVPFSASWNQKYLSHPAKTEAKVGFFWASPIMTSSRQNSGPIPLCKFFHGHSQLLYHKCACRLLSEKPKPLCIMSSTFPFSFTKALRLHVLPVYLAKKSPDSIF